jgi:flagellar assembly protein FliH
MTPFKFDTEFTGGGDRVSLAARGRAKRNLTTDEIESMCAQARAEGTASGEARALEAIAQATRDVAAVLRQALERSHDEIDQVRQEAAAIAFAAARKIAPMALDALPAADVERALRDAIHQAIGEPRIVLRASPRVIEALSGRIAEIAQDEGYEGRVVASADPAIRNADCRIEWRGGGAERSEAAILEALGEIITRRFSRKESQ